MAFLDAAARMLGSAVKARSPVYETPPVGPPQPSYLNAAFRLETDLGPEALLERLLDIEAMLGRVREVRWGPRTLDLDLLFIDGVEVRSPRLTVPHPRLHERAFALAPLLDVAPELADRYGAALVSAGGSPPLRVEDPGGPEAALAAAVNRWLPAGPVEEVVRVEAESAARWVEKATKLAGARAVTVEPIGPSGVAGAVLRDTSEHRRPGLLSGTGLQVVVIAGPSKVG